VTQPHVCVALNKLPTVVACIKCITRIRRCTQTSNGAGRLRSNIPWSTRICQVCLQLTATVEINSWLQIIYHSIADWFTGRPLQASILQYSTGWPWLTGLSLLVTHNDTKSLYIVSQPAVTNAPVIILTTYPRKDGFKHVIFTRESSYSFQRVLAIAILSVRLSVTRVNQSKAVQAIITKSSPSAAWKTLVSGTIKLFHKFEGGSPRTKALNERGGQNLQFLANKLLYLSNSAR